MPTGAACPGVLTPSGLGAHGGSGTVGVHSEWATVAERAGAEGCDTAIGEALLLFHAYTPHLLRIFAFPCLDIKPQAL